MDQEAILDSYEDPRIASLCKWLLGSHELNIHLAEGNADNMLRHMVLVLERGIEVLYLHHLKILQREQGGWGVQMGGPQICFLHGTFHQIS
jgi:hypothetical protein